MDTSLANVPVNQLLAGLRIRGKRQASGGSAFGIMQLNSVRALIHLLPFECHCSGSFSTVLDSHQSPPIHYTEL